MNPRKNKAIDKLAWLVIRDNKLLVARSKGKDIFYIPGGKRESGESDAQALMREIKEELSVDLLPQTIQHVAVFKAEAHGQADGVMVKMTCFFADYTGTLQVNNEIEELSWVSYEEKDKCSKVTQMIMDWLNNQNILCVSSSVSNKSLKDICPPQQGIGYEWLLFDADKTLFHFDDFAGLQRMFGSYNVTFTKEDYIAYQNINKPLWTAYQQGTISAEDVQTRRFAEWGKKLNIAPSDLNRAFLNAMADLCAPLDGGIRSVNPLKNWPLPGRPLAEAAR